MQCTKYIKTFILSSRPTTSVPRTVLGQLPPRKIAPPPHSKTNPDPNPNPNQGAIFLWLPHPILKLTLTSTQTPTLTRRQFPSGGEGRQLPGGHIFRPGHQFVLLGEYEYAKIYFVLLQFFCRFMSSMKLFFPLRFAFAISKLAKQICCETFNSLPKKVCSGVSVH